MKEKIKKRIKEKIEEKSHESAKEALEKINYDDYFLKNIMKGFLKLMILWIISKERIHGYEIIKKMKETGNEENDQFRGPGPNKIYPILHELEKKELIKGDWELHGKRKVKYYEATDKGINTLEMVKKRPHKNVPPIVKEFWREVISNSP